MAKKRKPPVICVSETHTTANIDNSEINLRNYNVYRCDTTNSKTGGVAIYVNKKLMTKLCFCENFLNNVWTLSVQTAKEITNGSITVIYHSPNANSSDATFLDYFEKWSADQLDISLNNIVCGDFNIDLMKMDTYSKRVTNIINNTGMKQIVNSATRITKKSKTLIDYVISNNYLIKANVLLDDKISDHCTIEIELPKKCSIVSESKIVSKFVNYSKEAICEDLKKIDWNSVKNCGLNEKASFLINKIKQSVKRFVKDVKVNECDNKWYNDELAALKNKRDIEHAVAVITDEWLDWMQYSSTNKLYRNNVKVTKSFYIKNKLSAARGDQKKMWRVLKEILNGNKDDLPAFVEFNGMLKSDSAEIANELNEYYVESIKAINESIPVVNDDYPVIDYQCSNFQFKTVTIGDIERVLRNITSHGDCENINKKVLNDIIPVVSDLYLDVINTSLQQGEFINDWKLSIIAPTPKVPGAKKCEELRPINMLPTYEKVFEGVVREQLANHTSTNNIIIEEQSGFRNKHSCETAINSVIADWKKELDGGKKVIAVFLDLKRAFETINRRRLIKKMEGYGIKGKEIRWFRSFLTGRTQSTKYGKATSTPLPNEIGVPQGSKLASDLFLLYINDIKRCLKECKIRLFADDTLIYIAESDINVAMAKINNELKSVNSWLCANQLKLNIEKTKCMAISIHGSYNHIEIKIGNETIECVKTIKYLGIMIDNNLKFKNNIEFICKKVAKKIGFLARISKNLNFMDKITIYKTIIAPHFDYCATLLSSCNQNEMGRMQKLQNRAMRIVLRVSKRTKITDMLEALSWMSIKQRIWYQSLIFIFKLKNGMLPNDMTKHISYTSDRHHYQLRNINDFNIDRTKKKSTENSIFYKGVLQYNSLPDELKSENRINIFKRKLAIFVKNKF